ncbi:MAG: beta-propeller domain-containing protein, partial [Victivallales bacterium]
RQTFRNFISAFDVFSESDIYKTKIFKFNMNDGRLAYVASGKVPGSVLNQFSMDEYEDCFRIATTQGDVWRSGEGASKNNVYVFDGAMNMVGKLEGIAPGEKIYSVRFMGERGYMVTFRTVDPFFVLDLKDPCNPRILGELKIPGYSDYLHPYDANHVIGFGKDAVELWGAAFYMGMKMAIFDVSDVSKPREMFSEKIGDRGTDSELLRNHKALLFSKDRNLLAFPVRVMEVKGDGSGSNVLQYGSFSFQGAYVYSVNLRKGFVRKGKITHLSREDYIDAGNYWYDSEKDIERIIHIDDTLYTLSKGMIKANNLDDLRETGSLEIE